jgi:hypothetical protein
MPIDKLKTALAAVNWAKNIDIFFDDTKSVEALTAANLRLAIWARQFEIADKGNPALAFVREMQVASQHVAVLVALSLYKPAAGSIRSMLETALYYSYFRTHPAELETLARAEGYYLEKRDILDFHKRHTLRFNELQQKLGVISRLEKWYGQVSSVVHGQIPGAWVEHKAVGEIKPIKKTQDFAINAFVEGEDIVHRFFLCTAGTQLWDMFSSPAKKELLAGLHGDDKKALQLDAS